MAVYDGRNRRFYSNGRNVNRYNVPVVRHGVNTNDLGSDVPPESVPPTDGFPNTPHSAPLNLNRLLRNVSTKGLTLDTDTMIVLGVMYLLYKEDRHRESFKLLLALGYILV